jgi:hypothetical protein
VSPSGGTSPSTSPGSGVAPTTEFASLQTKGSTAQSGQLPFTGDDLPLLVLIGASTLLAGALLRRLARSGAR